MQAENGTGSVGSGGVDATPGISASQRSAGSNPEHDFDHRVQFAHTAPPVQGRRTSVAALVVGWGTAGAIFAAVVLFRMVARALHLPGGAMAASGGVLAVALLAWVVWLFVRWFRANRRLPPNFVRSDERYRVRCVGTEERLAEVRRIGPIEDTPFEPQEFVGYLILPPTARMIAAWIATSVLVAAGVMLANYTLTTVSYSGFVFHGSFAAGGVMVVLLWPTRIRVVPGRVEIERALVFRPERAERRLFTLRTSRVLVDLRTWRAHVQGPSPETSIDLWLRPVRGRAELAHALLMGAVSSANPAPMDGDTNRDQGA